MKTIAAMFVMFLLFAFPVAAEPFEKDTLETSRGLLEITFVGHGTLVLTWNGKVFHIDPWGRLADYSTLPEADVVLITHHHADHLDPAAVQKVRKKDTTVILTEKCADKIEGGAVMKNGDVRTVAGVRIEAVPAYNLVHKRESGEPFHPKGEGNGYVLTFGETRVYVAGDTENVPEMKALGDIDCAFLPMNLPYTMTPEMVADAAASLGPKILYPYHYGDADTSKLVELLAKRPDIEIRIRRMK